MFRFKTEIGQFLALDLCWRYASNMLKIDLLWGKELVYVLNHSELKFHYIWQWEFFSGSRVYDISESENTRIKVSGLDFYLLEISVSFYLLESALLG